MRRLALPLVVVLFTVPAGADEVGWAEQCLARIGGGGGATLDDCLNHAADACQKEPEHQNAMGAVHCLERETEVWDAILNARYKALRAGMKTEEAAALRDMQRAWIKARDTECALTTTFFSRYSGSAGAQWGTACRRDRTAERAALLDDWAMRLQDF